jgi:hypothetical protein
MDPELEHAIHEFLKLRRKVSHLSEPIHRKVVDFIKSSSDEIRHACMQSHVEDGTESSAARDGGGQHNGHRSSPSPSLGPSSDNTSCVGNEVDSQPTRNHLRDRGSDSDSRTNEESNVGKAGPQPHAGHAANGQPSPSDVAQGKEQEQHQVRGGEQVRRTGLTGDPDMISAPSNDTESTYLTAPVSTVNGSSVDGDSAASDSSENCTRPSRQAALRARENFCGQSGRDAPPKRRKRVEFTSVEIEAVPTIES